MLCSLLCRQGISIASDRCVRCGCAGVRLQSVACHGGDCGAVQRGSQQPSVACARDPVRPRLHLRLRRVQLRPHTVGAADVEAPLARLWPMAGVQEDLTSHHSTPIWIVQVPLTTASEPGC